MRTWLNFYGALLPDVANNFPAMPIRAGCDQQHQQLRWCWLADEDPFSADNCGLQSLPAGALHKRVPCNLILVFFATAMQPSRKFQRLCYATCNLRWMLLPDILSPNNCVRRASSRPSPRCTGFERRCSSNSSSQFRLTAVYSQLFSAFIYPVADIPRHRHLCSSSSDILDVCSTCLSITSYVERFQLLLMVSEITFQVTSLLLSHWWLFVVSHRLFVSSLLSEFTWHYLSSWVLWNCSN